MTHIQVQNWKNGVSIQFNSIQSTLFIPYGAITLHYDELGKNIKQECTIRQEKDINIHFKTKKLLIRLYFT